VSKISKRVFLQQVGATLAGSACLAQGLQAARVINPEIMDAADWLKECKECMYYIATPRGLRCQICPNECQIMPCETGNCRSRTNVHGKLITLAYGNPCAVHRDPIEKKPLYHFHPGTFAWSVGTAGCNFACLNCQNWLISQTAPSENTNLDLMPSKLAEQAFEKDCVSIAYTYTEPFTFYEYVFDTSQIARKYKINNVLVSNGYVNEKPLRDICRFIDAATIDIKAFDENVYMKLNAGTLQPVLNTLKILKEQSIWLEISYLIVPGWTDESGMIQRFCEWLFNNGFEYTPLHFLRFFPAYKLKHLPPTPLEIMYMAREIALNHGIKYVYLGNVPDEGASHTLCHRCGKRLIERKGFEIVCNQIRQNLCGYCGQKIPGIWHTMR
jgi:pyruvate formate lyase activating enzyme